jgi:integrase
MNTKAMIEQYIEAKQGAWSLTTLRTEATRLAGLAGSLTGKPAELWAELEKRRMAPYARVTVWTRVCNFWGWAIEHGHAQGPNLYSVWRKEKAQWFTASKVYTPKHCDMTLREARARISTMSDSGMQEKAMQLLLGGLRYEESFHVEELGPGHYEVRGKGGKLRRVPVAPCRLAFHGGYTAFQRALKRATGLTPHQLRKIMATECARSGMQEADLCKLFGWECFTTAHKYIAPRDWDNLADTIGRIQGGDSREQPIKISASRRAG